MLNLVFLRNKLPYKKNLTKKKLYKNVDFVRSFFGISLDDYPISFYEILKDTNLFHICFYNFAKTSGCLVKDPNRKPVIIIKSNAKNTDFILAHEFFHYLLGADVFSENFLIDSLNNINSYDEWCANEGAAELLMPHKEFMYDLQYISLNKPFQVATQQLSEKYGLSKTVIKYRILNLLDLYPKDKNLLRFKNYFDLFNQTT